MKRAVLIFVIAALVLVTTGLWIFSEGGLLNKMDGMTLGILAVLISFAVFIGIKRLSGARRGEPAEDELSRRILQKTAATSYYISLYLWVALIYIKDRVTLDVEELLGAGIMGMALCFAGCWLYYNFRGIRNE